MSVQTFIPEVWSARLLENLDKNLVYANLLNRDYEGDISQYGDTVHINSIGDIAVRAYSKGNDITVDDVNMSEQTLIIDQGDYFAFKVNDVDKVQARADYMNTAMGRAAYSLSDKTDQYLAGLLKAGTVTAGLGTDGTPLSIKSDNAYETLVKIKTALDKKNVPTAGRWVVMPPEFEGAMLGDIRFVATGSSQAEGRLTNGMVARAAGFDIYISNNVPNTAGAKFKIIASVNMAATYADQILKTEATRMEKGFDDLVKGLHVYGAKVTRPEIVAVATVDFA